MAFHIYQLLISNRMNDKYKAADILDDPACNIDDVAFRDLLIKAIENDFTIGKEDDLNDPMIARTRCWLLEALAQRSAGDENATKLVIKHIEESYEPYVWARYWAFEGLIKRKNPEVLKVAEKMQDKEGLEKQLEKLPDKVTLESLLDRPMSQCDLEKKCLYDLMQIIAYHARERLVDEFRHSYNRQQDLKQILDKITNKGGYVRLIGNTLVVLLDWIERPSHREAAESLCQRVNRQGITMQGRLSPRLHFAMAQSPLIGV